MKIAPPVVYICNIVLLICDLSAIMPRMGLLSATIAVDTATPRLHIELPVNVNPRNVVDCPKASLNRTTK